MDVAVFGSLYLEQKMGIVGTLCEDDIAQGYRDQRQNEMMAWNGKVEGVKWRCKGVSLSVIYSLGRFQGTGLGGRGWKSGNWPGEKSTWGKFWPGENFDQGKILTCGKFWSGETFDLGKKLWKTLTWEKGRGREQRGQSAGRLCRKHPCASYRFLKHSYLEEYGVSVSINKFQLFCICIWSFTHHA